MARPGLLAKQWPPHPPAAAPLVSRGRNMRLRANEQREMAFQNAAMVCARPLPGFWRSEQNDGRGVGSQVSRYGQLLRGRAATSSACSILHTSQYADLGSNERLPQEPQQKCKPPESDRGVDKFGFPGFPRARFPRYSPGQTPPCCSRAVASPLRNGTQSGKACG